MRRVFCWMLCVVALVLMVPAALWAADVWSWVVLERPLSAAWEDPARGESAATLLVLGAVCALAAFFTWEG